MERETMPINICEWIRDSIPHFKLSEAKGFLSQYEGYFDVEKPRMIEHVYRDIKNSLKVEYAYEEAVAFVGWLIYLVSPEKKALELERVEDDLVKLVGQKSFLYRFFLELQDARGRVEKKRIYRRSYLLYGKATLTFLGSATMFYYILTSVVGVAERALGSKEYKFEGALSWEEAIATYVLAEFAFRQGSAEREVLEMIEIALDSDHEALKKLE